jgi:hypothetical protein
MGNKLATTAALVCASFGCGASPGGSNLAAADESAALVQGREDQQEDHEPSARGAFSCDFSLPADVPFAEVPPAIERDRMYMSARPGFIEKHIPLAFDPATGNLFSGGRYLFEKRQDAAAYHDFVAHGFVLDGVQFLSRPIFLAPECHDWAVIGSEELRDIHTTHIVMRTERFAMSGGDAIGALASRWPALRREAARRGYTSVNLAYNREQDLAQLVYYADRVGPPDPTSPDFASLAALAQAPALGERIAGLGWPRTFDRTSWVLTVWFPFRAGDSGEPAVWPSSPPFPAPFCADGVCEISRGESAETCPTDCPPACGDAVCETGEDTHNCPGDCRI